jgi:hypothetical protein
MSVAGVYLPASETRVAGARTRLDEFMPVYQFGESHSADVGASRDRVWRAMWEARPEEIRFAKTLMRIRGLGDLIAPRQRPILESFTAGGFQLLVDEPGREIVACRAGDGRGTLRALDGNPRLCGRPAGGVGRGGMRRGGNNSRGSGV